MSHCLRPHQIVNPHFNPKTALGAKNLRVWRIANGSSQGYPEDYQVLGIVFPDFLVTTPQVPERLLMPAQDPMPTQDPMPA